MRRRRSKREQILVWSGVVAQLVRTRANRILKDAGLPYPQFVLLRHFCHDPEREWTVTQLAAAFETRQPGITKNTKRLLDLGLLTARIDPDDSRRRWLRVTKKGLRRRDALIKMLEPDQDQFFRGWKANEIDELHGGLERLKTYLDENRDAIVFPGSSPTR
ncbi:MAG: winged helix-turn-helix transcriptional regulator [bacterium]|nr:winged helix-turn-helix transcriptional regulator [bacterium]